MIIFNNRHTLTKSSSLNCATENNCDNLGATTEEKETFLLMRLAFLGKVSLQIENKIQKLIAK